ncbi:MAG: hypothetical protein WA936_13840 [Erythrobacter sp.]|uniref:hypothetical protein n=1 Tax=Erythrobacter sp. TaxID=1042 RepID=UPI003C74FD07
MKGNDRTGRLGAAVGGHAIGTGWRTFFYAASIYNFVIGALGMFSPAADVDGRVVGLLVFSFGIIYLLVARDPFRFAPALWAGLIGKVGVVALLLPEALGPRGESILVAILAIDGLFAIGFLAFLLTKADNA